MQGHVLPFPQLHCGAMPFLGMAASVVVVVQVPVMDFFRVLARDLLYQAGLFCFVLVLGFLLIASPFAFHPFRRAMFLQTQALFLIMFSSGLPLRRWTAALRMRPLDSSESGPPTAGGTTGGPQPRAGAPPATQQGDACKVKGGHATNAAGQRSSWPKVTSWQALQSIALKAKTVQGTGGPTNRGKDGPPQGQLPQGAANEKGPTPAKTASLGWQLADAMHGSRINDSKRKVQEPMSTWTSERQWGSAAHGRGINVDEKNLNEPKSTLTSGPQWKPAEYCPAEDDERGSLKGSAQGSGSTASDTRFDFPIIRAEEGRSRIDDPGHDSDAVARVLRETHTATSRKSIRGRLLWWEARAKRRGIAPYPLDHCKLKLAAGLLKSGQYRSAGQYLYTIKKAHIEQGFDWQPNLDALLGDLRRSCTRGLGGTRQAATLPIGMLSASQRFCSTEWPRGWEAILVGSWWLLREVELASLRKKDFRFVEGHGCGGAELTVRASKADTKAEGCMRAHACTCPATICPVKAARALTEGLSEDDRVLQDKQGRGLSKRDTVRLLKAFAASQKADTTRITGHSLRTTGAQHLAEAGLSSEQIRLFGRWASSANMLKYARDAHIRPGLIADALKKRHCPTAAPSGRARKRWCTFRSSLNAGG